MANEDGGVDRDERRPGIARAPTPLALSPTSPRSWRATCRGPRSGARRWGAPARPSARTPTSCRSRPKAPSVLPLHLRPPARALDAGPADRGARSTLRGGDSRRPRPSLHLPSLGAVVATGALAGLLGLAVLTVVVLFSFGGNAPAAHDDARVVAMTVPATNDLERRRADGRLRRSARRASARPPVSGAGPRLATRARSRGVGLASVSALPCRVVGRGRRRSCLPRRPRRPAPRRPRRCRRPSASSPPAHGTSADAAASESQASARPRARSPPQALWPPRPLWQPREASTPTGSRRWSPRRFPTASARSRRPGRASG